MLRGARTPRTAPTSACSARRSLTRWAPKGGDSPELLVAPRSNVRFLGTLVGLASDRSWPVGLIRVRPPQRPLNGLLSRLGRNTCEMETPEAVSGLYVSTRV